MFRSLLQKVPGYADLRTALADTSQRHETLRKKLAELEARGDVLDKRLRKCGVATERVTPFVSAVMREGVPLEIFTRLTLRDAGYSVRGKYRYRYFNLDGVWLERSVDIDTSRDSTFTIPADAPSRAGESWPERDHLLVEAKQRRQGVTWVFCELPVSEPPPRFGPPDVPYVNFAFELRPGAGESGEVSTKVTANTKDVANGIAQLEYARAQKLTEIENEWQEDHKDTAIGRGRLASAARRDHLWLLLVTNARLVLFRPPSELSSLESTTPSREDDLFAEAPWLIYQDDQSLHLLGHQEHHLAGVEAAITKDQRSASLLAARLPATIHIVNYSHLARFLDLVKDPPRIWEIVIQMSSGGSKSRARIR